MPKANVVTETPSNWPFSFATLPASWRRMSPVVNISECTP